MNLLQQLKLYGLNPKEWNLKLKFVNADSPLIASIEHKEIRDLRLIGLCELREGSVKLEFSQLSMQLF